MYKEAEEKLHYWQHSPSHHLVQSFRLYSLKKRLVIQLSKYIMKIHPSRSYSMFLLDVLCYVHVSFMLHAYINHQNNVYNFYDLTMIHA